MKSSLQKEKKGATWLSRATAFEAEGSMSTKPREVLHHMVLITSHHIPSCHVTHLSTQQQPFTLSNIHFGITLFNKDCEQFSDIAVDVLKPSMTLFSNVEISLMEKCAEIES